MDRQTQFMDGAKIKTNQTRENTIGLVFTATVSYLGWSQTYTMSPIVSAPRLRTMLLEQAYSDYVHARRETIMQQLYDCAEDTIFDEDDLPK